MENYTSFFDILSLSLGSATHRSRRRYGITITQLSNISGRLLIIGNLVYDCERVSRKRKRAQEDDMTTECEDGSANHNPDGKPFIMVLVRDPDLLDEFETVQNFWVNTVPNTTGAILFYGEPTKKLRLRIGKMFTIKARNLVTKYPHGKEAIITTNATFQCTFDNSTVR